jgi:PKHD-type hydroxylase
VNLTNYYWYFASALSTEVCDKIIKEGTAKKPQVGTIHTIDTSRNMEKDPLSKQEVQTLTQKRDSEVVFFSKRWVYDTIQPYVRIANKKAGWNFEWDWSEAAQFTIYTKGMHYNWHVDSLPEPYTEEGPLQGKIRKLTSVVVLSDPSEYKGGELEFQFQTEDPQFNKQRQIRVAKEVAPKGSIIVFPSFVWHRVKPVTKGVRYTMPTWHCGWPFK